MEKIVDKKKKRKKRKNIDYDELIETKRLELEELEMKNLEHKKEIFFKDFTFLFDKENYKKYLQVKRYKTTLIEEIKIFILQKLNENIDCEAEEVESE